MDFQTSVSADEGRDIEANILHGSLNVRIHRRGDLANSHGRGDSARETGDSNGSCGSPSSSSQNDRIPYQVRIHVFQN